MEVERTVSRGRFFRRIGKLTAIGLGIAAVPAQLARAEAGAYCCRDSSCGECSPGVYAFKCWDNCSGTTCCVGCLGWNNCQYDLPCLC